MLNDHNNYKVKGNHDGSVQLDCNKSVPGHTVGDDRAVDTKDTRDSIAGRIEQVECAIPVGRNQPSRLESCWTTVSP